MIARVSLTVLALAGVTAHADPAAWRLTGDGAGQIWLLGSVHYLRDRDHPLPAVVDELYARADAIVMEIDLDDLDPMQSQASFMQAAMLPAGGLLRDVLDTDLYAHAEREARAFGIDLATLDRFEPWLVAITITDFGMSRLGFRAERGVEQHVLAKAREDGKTVLGLETVGAQLAVFDRLTLAEQHALLEQTLAELAAADQVMSELVDAWRRGDLEPLADALMAEFAEFPELYEALVVERNESWIAELERLLADDSDYLVVVGALHLVGPDSVVDMLRARGHAVTAVSSSPAAADSSP